MTIKLSRLLLSSLISLVLCPHLNAQEFSAVYLQESFDAMFLPSGWSTHTIVGPFAGWTFVGTGTNPPAIPFSGVGQAKFNSYDAGPGEQARLVSRRVNLGSAADPFLSFAMYHDEEYPSSLDSVVVEASSGDSVAGPWTILGTLTRPSSMNMWIREALSLLTFAGQGNVFIGLRGVSRFGNNIYIDEFLVADSSFHDIGAIAALTNALGERSSSTSLSRSQNAAADNDVHGFYLKPQNTTITLSATTRNFGTFDEPAYQMGWIIDGALQAPVSNVQSLLREGTDTVSLVWPSATIGSHLARIWTVLASDLNGSNDTISYPFEVMDSTAVLTETFNSPTFPPTGWITVNRDGGMLSPWFTGNSSSAFPPFEGSGFAANNFQRSNGQYIDDYLISPPVAGVNQPGVHDSLVFFARSVFYAPPQMNVPDSIMVMLSTTGADTSSFSSIVEYFEVPKASWFRKSYRIDQLVPPGSAVSIAFRYLHYAGGLSGTSSDFVGIDAVQVKRGIPTSLNIEPTRPFAFRLDQNYPNPFNPSTTIAFALSSRQHATLTVFDVLGRQVDMILDRVLESGDFTATWVPGPSAPSGVYYYRLVAGMSTITRKMILLR